MKTKKIQNGDIIDTNELKGKVISINLLETKIETNNKELIFIPNSGIVKYKVVKKRDDKSLRANRNRRKRS